MSVLREMVSRLVRIAWPAADDDPCVVAVDVETTGLDPKRRVVVEVGWAGLIGRELVSRDSMFVFPASDPALEWDPKARELIGDRLPKPGKPLPHIDRALHAICLEAARIQRLTGRKPTLVMHNAPFDMSFLAYSGASVAWLINDEHGPFERRVFDTQTITSMMSKQGRLRSPALSKSCEELGCINGDHTAAGDAAATAVLAAHFLRDWRIT